ncbi:MAG: TraB/GumN family protein [Gemmatimonadaceae bacterium]
MSTMRISRSAVGARGVLTAAMACVVAASIAASIAAVRPAPPRHMLFRVSGPHGATVYLLGSVHLLNPEAGTLPPEVDSAFARAKVVAFETSLDSLQARAPELLALARNAPGTTLRSLLTPAGGAKADSILKGYGLSVDALAQFKPWFAAIAMTQIVIQRAHFQPQYGVDAQINLRAHAANKPTTGLESVDFQMHLFDSFTPAQQEEMLLSASPLDSSAAELVSIKDAWVAGNTAKLDSVLNNSMRDSPALFDKIVVERNKSWIPKIDAMLQGTTDALVVVGAAHLVGKQGVVEMLRAQGYTVDQL